MRLYVLSSRQAALTSSDMFPPSPCESLEIFLDDVAEASDLLRYDPTSLSNLFPAFRKNILLQSSGVYTGSRTSRLLNISALRTFDTPGTNYPVTWLHVSEERRSNFLNIAQLFVVYHFSLFQWTPIQNLKYIRSCYVTYKSMNNISEGHAIP